MIEGILGICFGMAAAAGAFALITIVGIVPRMAGMTHTGKHIRKYEWAIILGGGMGNLWYLFRQKLPPLPVLQILNVCIEGALGLGMGIFVGCLVMAIAESLQVLPLIARRLKLEKHLNLMPSALAFGKIAGALLYFWNI